MASLECCASLPPFKITALPDFKQSAKTSNVTLGRASYIMPTTPKGTDTLVKIIPFGRMVVESVRCSGEGSCATCRISSAMAVMRSAVSFSRSYLGFATSICAKSFALAARMVSVAFSAAEARAIKRLFLVASSIKFSAREAATVLSNRRRYSIVFFLFAKVVIFYKKRSFLGERPFGMSKYKG